MIELFHQIQSPDSVIIILLFNACAQLASDQALCLVKKVLRTIPKSFFENPRLLSSLIDALMKCGDVQLAQAWFEKSTNNVLSIYGAMMKG